MNAGKPASPVWTTAAEIDAQMQRLWDDGRLLRAPLRRIGGCGAGALFAA